MEEVPFQDRTVPRTEIDWDRSVWWWYPLTRSIHPAIRMTSLLFSLLAILLLQLGFQLADRWFSPQIDWSGIQAWTTVGNWSLPQADWIAQLPELNINRLAYFSFVILWIALISATFGGVLARRAAIELGQRTMGAWIHTIKLCTSRLSSYLWAAGMHFIAIACLLIPIAVLGGLSRLGPTTAAISGVFMLMIGVPLIFSVGRLFLSLTACYPLSVCAISIERKADAFDGFSRSNAYLFQRPVVAAICVIVLAFLGDLGSLLVQWVVRSGWVLISEFYLWSGGGNEASQQYLSAGDWFASELITAFRFSFFWSGAAALYLVLRRSVDNTPLEEMEMFESEMERQPPQIPTTSQPAAPGEVSPNQSSSETQAASSPSQEEGEP